MCACVYVLMYMHTYTSVHNSGQQVRATTLGTSKSAAGHACAQVLAWFSLAAAGAQPQAQGCEPGAVSLLQQKLLVGVTPRRIQALDAAAAHEQMHERAPCARAAAHGG